MSERKRERHEKKNEQGIKEKRRRRDSVISVVHECENKGEKDERIPVS